MATVVTFDIGQTLVDLDLDFLARRLGERRISVDRAALERAQPAAWRRYDELTDQGASHPWKAFMQALLDGANVANPEPLVEWLYAEQPRKNLWRKPIEPMVALVRELRARGVRVAALSNSEGGLAELLAEIELAPLLEAIIDSQVVGVAKPEPRIFELALEQLGVRAPQLAVHVGDSWAADVEGALAAGWKPIWYRSRAGKPSSDANVPIASDAAEVRTALVTLGIAL